MSDWLTGALEHHSPADYPWREEAPADDVEVGDILVVTSMDGREPADRMVLAYDVEPEQRCFLGLLMTSEAPMADNTDPVLHPDDTGLPYRIAVMTHASGWLWYVQIKHRVGSLTDEALEAVSAGRSGAGDEFHHKRRGLPLLREQWDMRWPTLLAEAAHIRALAKDCASKRWRKDFELPFADPRLLAASNGKPPPHEDTIERMAHGTQGFSPGCTAWAVENLDDQRFLAYRQFFRLSRNPAKSPMPNGCPLPLKASNDTEDHLLRLTVADALEVASFVKIAVAEEDGEPRSTYRSVQYGNRRAECILIPV